MKVCPRRQAVTLVLAILLPAIAVPVFAAPRIGIEGGLRYGQLTREAEPPFDFFPAPKYRPAWSLGGVVEQPVGRSVSLVSGLRYLETQDKITVNLTVTDQNGSSTSFRFAKQIALRSVELPVRVVLRPLLRGPLLESSVGVAYLLEAISQTEFSSVPYTGTRELQFAQIFEDLGTFDQRDETGLYRRWNVSLGLGTGWDFPVGRGLGTLRLRNAHGLTDMSKSSEVDRFTRAFELEAGWRW